MCLFLLKLNATTGVIESGFGRLGSLGVHYAHGAPIQAKMYVDSSGNIFAAYNTSLGSSTSYTHSSVVKWTSDGLVDSTWGQGVLADPHRYWRVEVYDQGIVDTQPTTIGKLYLGDHVEIRCDLSTSVSSMDKSKTAESWYGNEYIDRMKPRDDVQVNLATSTESEINDIEDYCRENGAHSAGVLDLSGSSTDLRERSSNIFWGNLDERSGFSSSRKYPTLYEGRIKFIEDPN